MKDLVARVVLGAAIVDLPFVALGTILTIPYGKWGTRAVKLLVKQGTVKPLMSLIDYDKPRKRQKKIIYERIDYGKRVHAPLVISGAQKKTPNYNHFCNYQTYS